LLQPEDQKDTEQNQPARTKRLPKKAFSSYRDFYYFSKMGWSPLDTENTQKNRRGHTRDYLEGLHWVLQYYHEGCPSWDWYFPHLYSPLCTDLVNLDEFYTANEDSVEVDEGGYKRFCFDRGTPFPSLVQLLSVLPPQSASLLPDALSELMLHPSSPLAQYYPRTFTSDPNGKRQPWEAVVQIPFIDGDELLDTVEQIMKSEEELLSKAERRRNMPGELHHFVPPGRAKGMLANWELVGVPLMTRRKEPTQRRRGGKK